MTSTAWPKLTTRGVDAMHYHTLSSTQDYMRQHWRVLPHYAICIADYQSEGRGRWGREWVAPESTALLMSVLIPLSSRTDYGWATIAAACAVHGALSSMHSAFSVHSGSTMHGTLTSHTQDFSPSQPRSVLRPHSHVLKDDHYAVKWPNDVVAIAGSQCLKIAGVLGEVLGEKEGNLCASLGIGVNLLQTSVQLPPGATSLAALYGLSSLPEYTYLRDALAERIYEYVRIYLTYTPEQLAQTLMKLSSDIGRQIAIEHNGTKLCAAVTGINNDGSLEMAISQAERASGTQNLLSADAEGMSSTSADSAGQHTNTAGHSTDMAGQPQTIRITCEDIALAAAHEHQARMGRIL